MLAIDDGNGSGCGYFLPVRVVYDTVGQRATRDGGSGGKQQPEGREIAYKGDQER